MIDFRKIALGLSIAILLPLCIGLFFDAIYLEPEQEQYCNYSRYSKPMMPEEIKTNCSDWYMTPEAQQCQNGNGQPQGKVVNGCYVYDFCDYCYRDYDQARQLYNRNLFFMLAPVGLAVIVLGIYFIIDYMGAGMILGGLFTLLYATIRYFSDMNKLMRATVLLAELIIIIWIAFMKIERKK